MRGRPPKPPILDDGRFCETCKTPLLRRQMPTQLEPWTYWKQRRFCSRPCMYVAARGKVSPCKKCGGTERKLGKCVPCRQAYRNTPARRHAQANQWRKFRYGINAEEFAAKLTAQNGECAICSIGLTISSEFKSKRNTVAHQDHNHVTGELRGILCHDCNTGIARFKENPLHLESAIAYLTKWKT